MHFLHGEAAIGEGPTKIEIGVQVVTGIIPRGVNVVNKDLVFFAEIVVSADDALINIRDAAGDSGVIDGAGDVGQRHILEQVHRNRVDPAGRNDIAWKGAACGGIDHRLAGGGKI